MADDAPWTKPHAYEDKHGGCAVCGGSLDDDLHAKYLPPEGIIVMLLKTIEEKTPIQSIEFGFHEDEPYKWWAKGTLRSGRVRMAEVEVDDMRLGGVQALAELGRELGLSIRIRDTVYLNGEAGDG